MESLSEHEQKSFYEPATYTRTPGSYSLEMQKLTLLMFLFLPVNSSPCRKGSRQIPSLQRPQTKTQPRVLLLLKIFSQSETTLYRLKLCLCHS